jgi:hypothetical protein
LAFFLVRFWAFLGKGSSKTPLKYFGEKSVAKPERLEVIGVAIPEINLWGPKEQKANGA